MPRNIDQRPDPANYDGERAAAPAVMTGGAIASLEALGAALANVDTPAIIGRTVTPMLQFKREGDGTWVFGQRKTLVEDNSCWAINPLTFRWGFICFNEAGKVVGERLVFVSQAKPDINELPDKGFEWSEQWAVNLKCLDGTDAGVEVTYKPTTVGGIQAIASIIEAVRDRLAGAHEGNVAPIVHLEKASYPHAQYGRVYTPLLTVVSWMPLEGPAPAPAPKPAAPAPAGGNPAAYSNQPRRRRVG